MRTTITIDEHLLRQAKTAAAKSGKSLSDIISDALQELLLQRKTIVQAPQRPLPVFDSGGAMPGVDISNNAHLHEMMDMEDMGRWDASSGR
jgi:hypothetical protein